jgi:uncharacterized protein (DUF1778 family)
MAKRIKFIRVERRTNLMRMSKNEARRFWHALSHPPKPTQAMLDMMASVKQWFKD